jgi:uncharacterized UBP type Zn finger protein
MPKKQKLPNFDSNDENDAGEFFLFLLSCFVP